MISRKEKPDPCPNVHFMTRSGDAHTVTTLPTGQTQLFIGLHLVHEVTTPQAFDMMRERGLSIAYPQRTFATADHIVPTDTHARPFADDQAEAMMAALEKNVSDFGIEFYGLGSDRQGIVHVIGPQLGLTQPGMTLACGDSHTSTHGAFGTLALRHRYHPGPGRAVDPDPVHGPAQRPAHQRQRQPPPGGARQGRDPHHHPDPRSRRRQGVRVRVRRRGAGPG